ncbi:hypothetical protein CWO17_21420 [Vibrio sp. 10N.286.45.A3]|uniref:KilA-N domain-containing protein n=1 Tax=Vibrio TaxID=662 RepID=UPI000D38E590|nr:MULTISPECIES: KilA-N domain-containing protein [unclassified Vibrio]CAK2901694.1 KilA-N domain-containing protein [Vibrio crassostreae]MBB1463021.1 KilA-N domain-containing protein [Vibrio sp. SG41-7]PTO97422.1 hypothetical protein CWO17_21420 [Vibrio sp. 10N.286.45.A3]TKE80102.1 hypothetical protein FCV56_16020 [Vibrio sp. F12]TKE81179.1 hypothetical protein FCV54_13280 [Vibrio sp. F12]
MAKSSVGIINRNIHSSLIDALDDLYSLNDLHKASGGHQNNNKPVHFLKNKQTQYIIDQITNSYHCLN